MSVSPNQPIDLAKLPDAAPLLRADGIPGPSFTINEPWFHEQGEFMVKRAIQDGRIPEALGRDFFHLFVPQPDGHLFCAVGFPDAPGLLLGTMVPAGEWTPK